MNSTNKAIWTSLVIALFALLSRFAYIEYARFQMNDFNRALNSALSNRSLKSKWETRINQIKSRYQPNYAASCDDIRDEPLQIDKPRIYNPYDEFEDVNTNCLSKKAIDNLNADIKQSIDDEILRLGTYDEWVLNQSGLRKYHNWLKYSQDLRDRVAKGERGLMLGNLIKNIW